MRLDTIQSSTYKRAGIKGELASNPRRTKKEQRDYANSGTAKEWLIPGVGQYNMWKSLGRAIGDSVEREAAKAAAGAAAPAMA